MQLDEVVIKQSSKHALISFGDEVRNPTTGELIVEKAKQMIAVEDRNLILTQDNFEVYAWGGNERGQLGLGHYADVYVPTKVDFFTKQKLKVMSVAAGGILTLACTDNGNAYAWPYEKAGAKISLPVQMPFSEKINI
jgi:alpha-tubulin suppressor-like RCC1 family protein